eukprot:gene19732-biopygen11066
MDGLQRGLDDTATTTLLRAKGKGALAALDAGFLRVIIAGAMWTRDRLHRCGLAPNGTCTFCTMDELEDQRHIFWRCPAWRAQRERHPVATRHYKEDWPNCLACCGLMPEDLTGTFDEKMQEELRNGTIGRLRDGDLSSQERGDEEERAVGRSPVPRGADELPERSLQVETWEAGHVVVFTDGAATNNQTPSLRQAGCGAWWGNSHAWNVSEPLQGRWEGERGNNRAELTAVLRVLERETRPVEIRTDSQYVYDGCKWHRARWRENNWRTKPGSAHAISHADLWAALDQLIEARPPGSVRLTKVKGHATLEDIAKARVHPYDKYGNDQADYLA